MDLEKIFKYKKEILEDLKEKINDIEDNVYLTDDSSLLVIFGEQKKPTQFDIEIKFHKFDDLDHFNIVNPINKKILEKIDKDSLNDITKELENIEKKYNDLINKAKNKVEKEKLQNKKMSEKNNISLPKTKKFENMDEFELLKALQDYSKKINNMLNFRFKK